MNIQELKKAEEKLLNIIRRGLNNDKDKPRYPALPLSWGERFIVEQGHRAQLRLWDKIADAEDQLIQLYLAKGE